MHRPCLPALALVACSAAALAAQQPGAVLGYQKISETQGGFTAQLDKQDQFGTGIAALGDLNGDGFADVAVGASVDDDGTPNAGAVYVLFLGPGGSVLSYAKISETSGGLGVELPEMAMFGTSVEALGDVTGDGICDLAVGAVGYGVLGAVFVLALDVDGTVKSHTRIDPAGPAFAEAPTGYTAFGSSVARLGDLDGDGICDIAVGADQDDEVGPGHGAVWILFLAADGSVKDAAKIGDADGTFGDEFHDFANFGSAVAPLGDFDHDGVPDLAVGAKHGFFSISGGGDPGLVYVLRLSPDGTVKLYTVIGDHLGGFPFPVEPSSYFGSSIANLGDLDGNGVVDLAVGASRTGTLAPPVYGSYFVLRMNADGTVKSAIEISEGKGGFSGTTGTTSYFGWSIEAIGDVDGDDIGDVAVGSILDDDGGQPLYANNGAIWVMHQDGFAPASVEPYGCGVNPPGSLTVLSGKSSPGGGLVLGVDNPLGTQASGSLPFVYSSLAPAAGYPCGVALPGFGMSGPGALGEVGIDLSKVVLITAGPPWAGPGQPAPIALGLPNDPALLGFAFFKQGVLVDPSSGASVPHGLTEPLELCVGL